MADDKLELASTYKGIIGSCCNNLFWTMAGAFGVYKSCDIIQGFYDKSHFSDFWDFFSTVTKSPIGFIMFTGLGIGALISGVFSLYYGSKFLDNFYKANTKNIIDHGKIKETTYGFPAKKETTEFGLEKLTRTTVLQGLIDRKLNTGTLSLEIITHTNKGLEKKDWIIPYIKDPEKAKKQVIENLSQKLEDKI
ncbi:MAG: hypothetical protein U9Q69_06320 [Nanoarchaeota archaeon]|nr:hypothetical protein [Nanoarchaeota archaeon]